MFICHRHFTHSGVKLVWEWKQQRGGGQEDSLKPLDDLPCPSDLFGAGTLVWLPMTTPSSLSVTQTVFHVPRAAVYGSRDVPGIAGGRAPPLWDVRGFLETGCKTTAVIMEENLCLLLSCRNWTVCSYILLIYDLFCTSFVPCKTTKEKLTADLKKYVKKYWWWNSSTQQYLMSFTFSGQTTPTLQLIITHKEVPIYGRMWWK